MLDAVETLAAQPPLTLEEFQQQTTTKWAPIQRRLDCFLSQSVAPPPAQPCTKPGLWVWKEDAWQPQDPDAIDTTVVLDFEAEQIEKDVWRPTCCAIHGVESGSWYFWMASEGDEVMPFPPKRIVIGHNSAAYDRRYLSAEYDFVDSKLVHIDTMQMAAMIQGMAEDKEGKNGSANFLLTKWKMFDQRRQNGRGVPVWYNKCGPVNLKFLADRYLGIDLDKSVRDAIIDDPTTVSADSLYRYCSNDVYITALLAQKLLPIARRYAPNDATWVGMTRVNSSKYYLRDWDMFLARSERQYQLAQDKLRVFQEELIEHALENEFDLPDLDWKKYIRGKYKGQPHWVKNAKETGPLSGNVSAYLLDLYWDSKKVSLYKPAKGEGTVPKWRTEDGPLPHPMGGNSNLGTPLCSDYVGFAKSGMLESKAVGKEGLVNIFEHLDSCTQWVSYRSRYNTIYRRSVREGLDLSVADLNGTGTVSRRSVGLWVVLPKPNKNKIGSDVMTHIVPPDGYDLVTADFVSQESRIACAVYGDAKAGKHFSTEWTKAVMVGRKEDKTDAHNLTAARFQIPRRDAKTINFLLQYGGGLLKLICSLILIKGISKHEAEKMCIDFMHWYKDRNTGVAAPIFNALKQAAHKEHGETYLLSVRQPNSINPKFLFDSSAFHTLRTNWPIQSAGVDEKHCLISLIEHYAKTLGIAKDIQFALDVHDRVGYFARKEVSHMMPAVFNKAMDTLMHISYEAAAKYWEKIDGRPRPVLKPLDNWRNFETVNVAQTLREDD